MDALKDIITSRRKTPAKRTSERGELLEEFLRCLIPDWDAKRFGKLTIGRLAKKLEAIPTKDLYYLKRVCEDSKNYSKRFFYEINPKKHEQQQQ